MVAIHLHPLAWLRIPNRSAAHSGKVRKYSKMKLAASCDLKLFFMPIFYIPCKGFTLKEITGCGDCLALNRGGL